MEKGRINVKEVRKLTSDDIKNQAGKFYDLAEQKGGTIKSNLTDDFLDNLQKSVAPQTRAGKILTGDNEVTQSLSRLEELRGTSLTLKEAQDVDQILGGTITKLAATDKAAARKFGIIQDELRDIIEGADISDVTGGSEGFEALKEGRKLWARQSRLNEIERIIERADLTDNPATSLRSGFRTLVSNPKRIRGFSKTEQEMIRSAAKTGIVTDTLRVLGSRLIPIGSVATGGGLGAAAAAQVGATAARSAATRVQLRKASKLADSIANPDVKGGAIKRKTGKAQISAGKTLKLIDKALKIEKDNAVLKTLRTDRALVLELLKQEDK